MSIAFLIEKFGTTKFGHVKEPLYMLDEYEAKVPKSKIALNI